MSKSAGPERTGWPAPVCLASVSGAWLQIEYPQAALRRSPCPRDPRQSAWFILDQAGYALVELRRAHGVQFGLCLQDCDVALFGFANGHDMLPNRN